MRLTQDTTNQSGSLRGAAKKSAVLAKKGDEVKVVRFGDPNMSIKKDNPERRKSFRARHNCDTATDKYLPQDIGVVEHGKKEEHSKCCR